MKWLKMLCAIIENCVATCLQVPFGYSRLDTVKPSGAHYGGPCRTLSLQLVCWQYPLYPQLLCWQWAIARLRWRWVGWLWQTQGIGGYREEAIDWEPEDPQWNGNPLHVLLLFQWIVLLIGKRWNSCFSTFELMKVSEHVNNSIKRNEYRKRVTAIQVAGNTRSAVCVKLWNL